MTFQNFDERLINKFDKFNRKKINRFLQTHDLNFDELVEFSVAIYEDNNIIATGSFDGPVIKCLAVDPSYQGSALTNKVISKLMSEQFARGYHHLFIYTKPKNAQIFKELGFFEIMSIGDEVTLLENKPDGIGTFIDNLRNKRADGKTISALVMNCNPFTKGHEHLIEMASKNSDFVHVFIVEEDRSVFSFSDRLNLVKKGCSHLGNVSIHAGGPYIISAATFPSYFIKDKGQVDVAHATLDLSIFAKFIAPALNISRRFVGNEPICAVTAMYNTIMEEILPQHNIEVVVVERLEVHNKEISASRVRKHLEDKNFHELRTLVPDVTYRYLIDTIKN